MSIRRGGHLLVRNLLDFKAVLAEHGRRRHYYPVAGMRTGMGRVREARGVGGVEVASGFGAEDVEPAAPRDTGVGAYALERLEEQACSRGTGGL